MRFREIDLGQPSDALARHPALATNSEPPARIRNVPAPMAMIPGPAAQPESIRKDPCALLTWALQFRLERSRAFRTTGTCAREAGSGDRVLVPLGSTSARPALLFTIGPNGQATRLARKPERDKSLRWKSDPRRQISPGQTKVEPMPTRNPILGRSGGISGFEGEPFK